MLNRVVMLIMACIGLFITFVLGWTFSDPGLWAFLVACPAVGMLVWAFQKPPKQ